MTSHILKKKTLHISFISPVMCYFKKRLLCEHMKIETKISVKETQLHFLLQLLSKFSFQSNSKSLLPHIPAPFPSFLLFFHSWQHFICYLFQAVQNLSLTQCTSFLQGPCVESQDLANTQDNAFQILLPEKQEMILLPVTNQNTLRSKFHWQGTDMLFLSLIQNSSKINKFKGRKERNYSNKCIGPPLKSSS